jgi:predicted transcriptional regulator
MDETASSISSLIDLMPASLSLDDAFDILADQQRRQLLIVLHQLETPERLSALARNLAADAGRSEAADAELLHIRLYHNHVPKLADAGIVSFDEDRRTVELTEQGQALAAALDQ